MGFYPLISHLKMEEGRIYETLRFEKSLTMDTIKLTLCSQVNSHVAFYKTERFNGVFIQIKGMF